jgi:immune inhibitor A
VRLALLCLALPAPARATMPPPHGPVAPEVAAAFQRGLFDVPERARGLETSAGQQRWRLPIIRVAFTDSAIVHPRLALEQRLFDTTGAVPTGSAAEYFHWASRGRLELRGEVVATVLLPRDRNYYAADAWGVNALGTPNNAYGMFRDAIEACDDAVDFSQFDMDSDGYVDMLWLVHAGPGGENTGNRRDLWSLTSRATSGWSNSSAAETDDLVPGSTLQHMRIDRFTVLPELSTLRPGQLSEIGVYCHEFGHTLGLPDLYDTSALGGAANVGPGNWSLMSTGAYGGNGFSPESPAHLGAWPLLWLGWASRLRPAQDTTLVLSPIADGGPVLDFWFQGEDSPEHFLIESRARGRFDANLEEEGLLITQVDEAVVGPRVGANTINTGPTPGLRILEADGDFDLFRGGNRGDPNDPFPGLRARTLLNDTSVPSTRTFLGAPTNISLEQIARSGRDVSLRVRVRAPGWQPPHRLAADASEPLEVFGPAPRAAIAPNGRAWHVSSELLSGVPRVVLRERPPLGVWAPPQIIDGGQGGAIEPTLARLGQDDLVVAWIDNSAGPGRLFYRSRLRGQWTVPRLLTPQTNGCTAPAIACDDRGRVFLAWMELVGGERELRFLQFLYSAPFGQPVTLTAPVDAPTAPAITAAGDGHAYVLWSDLGAGRHIVFASRFHPDSGMSARFPVGPNSAYGQPSVSAVVESSGVLHAVWQVSPGAGSEIHYQRRGLTGFPNPRDTTLDALGDGLQNPRIALDPMGGVHVAYERSMADAQQVRYKRRHPVLGWDHRATRVSDASDLTTSTIELLPTSPGNVSITWLGYDGVAQGLRESVRTWDGGIVTAVDPDAGAAPPPLFAGPNPLRAGQALELSGLALRPGASVDLFDASGRRLAELRADARGVARLAAERTNALAPGLYFARVRGTAAAGRIVVLR